MTNPMQLFHDYMAQVVKDRSSGTIEGPSPAYPDRMNVIVCSSSFEECQSRVAEVMDREGEATFTIPAKAADGSWLAYGHFPREV